MHDLKIGGPWLAGLLLTSSLLLAGACQSRAQAPARADAPAAASSTSAKVPADRGTGAASQTSSVTVLQKLVAEIAPAADSQAAAAEFSWSRQDATPAGGKLAAEYGVLRQQEAAYETELKEGARQTMSAMPDDIQKAAADPAAQQALAKKFESMTDAQKMAYAMDMARQTHSAVRAEMAAAVRPSAAEQAVLDRMSERSREMTMARAAPTGITAFIESVGEVKPLLSASEAAHQAIDQSRDHEITAVPPAHVTAISECYSPPDARRVRDIELRYADQHVARANQDLAAAARWAGTIRGSALPVARDDDGLMGDYSAVRHLFDSNTTLRGQYGSTALAIHKVTLGLYVSQFLDAIRDVDREAGRWAHDKAVLAQAPLNICR